MKIEIKVHGNYMFVGMSPKIVDKTAIITIEHQNLYHAFIGATHAIYTIDGIVDKESLESLKEWRERTWPRGCERNVSDMMRTLIKLYNRETGFIHNDGAGGVSINIVDCEYKLAIFVEGLDGCGKSELLKTIRASMANPDEYAFFSEMGSVPTRYSTPHNIKADVLHCRAESDCPARDAHYTFAERWHQASMLVADKTVKGAFIDRSWLTAVNYQGLEDPKQVPWILDQGIAFNKYLIDNGWLPIYIVLTNHPFRTNETDSLERRMGDKGIIYRLLAGDPIDVTVLESDDVMQCCTLIEDKLYKLPIFGCGVNEAAEMLRGLHERQGL